MIVSPSATLEKMLTTSNQATEALDSVLGDSYDNFLSPTRDLASEIVTTAFPTANDYVGSLPNESFQPIGEAFREGYDAIEESLGSGFEFVKDSICYAASSLPIGGVHKVLCTRRAGADDSSPEFGERPEEQTESGEPPYYEPIPDVPPGTIRIVYTRGWRGFTRRFIRPFGVCIPDEATNFINSVQQLTYLETSGTLTAPNPSRSIHFLFPFPDDPSLNLRKASNGAYIQERVEHDGDNPVGLRELRLYGEYPSCPDTFFTESSFFPEGHPREGEIQTNRNIIRVWQEFYAVSNISWIDIPCESSDAEIENAKQLCINAHSQMAISTPEFGIPGDPKLYIYYANCPVPAPPQPPLDNDEGDPMACNCEEMQEMLEAIYKRLGVNQFPFTVPETLTGESEATKKLEDYSGAFGYLIEEIDALLGQFPVDIEIEDADPVTKGNQTKKLSFPNISEFMAEMFILAYKASQNSDIGLNLNVRSLAELISVKNSSVIIQDYVKANAAYLGYRGNPKRRRIQYAVDPANLSNFDSLLQNSVKEVAGWQIEDRHSMADYMQRAVFGAAIIKAVFWRGADQEEFLQGMLDNTFQDDEERDRWEEFVREIRDPTSIYNRDAPIQPDVTNVGGE